MMKRLNFYALESDLILLLNCIEEEKSILYTLSGSRPTSSVQQWTKGEDVTDLGEIVGEQTALCQAFLITERGTSIASRRIEEFNGKVRYDVDQLSNPDSIILIPGGERKQKMIIAGIFSTNSPSIISQRLMKNARRALKKNFVRVNAFWVGPGALLRFRAGCRLTIAEQSPSTYNLREQS